MNGFREHLAVVMSVVFVVLSGNPTTFALTDEQRRLIHSGIRWYDPDQVACGSGESIIVNGDRTQTAYSYFLNKGLDTLHSAALIGNFLVETKHTMDPRISQGPGIILDQPFDETDGSTGYGIAQWTYPTRKANLKRFAENTGRANYMDVAYLNQDEEAGGNEVDQALLMQLDFVWFELTGEPPVDGVGGGGFKSFYVDFLEISDLTEAVVHINAWYEMSALGIEWRNLDPAVRWNEENVRKYNGTRIDAARDVFTQNDSSAYGSGSCVNDSSGLIGTVLSYAWPDPVPRRSISSTPAKEAYEDAVRAARANNEYVGGISYPGIDCGGFVTRVMRDSGFDPNYNSYEGNTVWQTRYLEENWRKVTVTSSADLQPGDVAMRLYPGGESGGASGHTFMFVGEIPNFNSEIASSALDSRAPAAGQENIFNYDWYRK